MHTARNLPLVNLASSDICEQRGSCKISDLIEEGILPTLENTLAVFTCQTYDGCPDKEVNAQYSKIFYFIE